jgi:hypothetical protein
MPLTEKVAGVIAGSVSLHADAMDFLGDSFNYAISLAVIGLPFTNRGHGMAKLPRDLRKTLPSSSARWKSLASIHAGRRALSGTAEAVGKPDAPLPPKR